MKNKAFTKRQWDRDNVRRKLSDFADIAKEAQIGVYASSGAFYLFLALCPSAALLCSLLPLLPFPQEAMLEYLSAVLPSVMQTLLQDIVHGMYSYSIAAFSISAVVLVWTAGRAFVGLLRGLNRIYCGYSRKYWKVYSLSILYMMIFLVSMVLTLSLSLFHRTLMQRLTGRWPQSELMLQRMMNLRFLPAMILLAVFFCCLYKFLPSGKRRFIDQIPGALLASALWMLLSWLFSLYLNRFGPNSVYGSLATVAFALLWIFWCMALVLLGGCFNVWVTGKGPPRQKKPEDGQKIR